MFTFGLFGVLLGDLDVWRDIDIAVFDCALFYCVRLTSFPAGAADDAAAGDAEEDDVTRAPAAAGAGVPDSRIQRGRFNPCVHRTHFSAA